MKKLWIILVVLGFSPFVGRYPVVQAQMDPALAPYIPKNMKPYYLDLLVKIDKPEAAPTPAERSDRMQNHLAYIRSQVEAGNFVLVGPLMEDNRIRGIAVIQAGSLQDAQKIASGDPLVQAGHLAVEVHPIMLVDLSSLKYDYPNTK
jgi:uncharacterized protein YciI